MITFESLKSALPEKGLFRGKELPFLLSPEPFRLEPKEVKHLEGLGRTLFSFQQACDRIYKRSKKEKITPWVAETLDTGKPLWLIEAQSKEPYINALPRVIRPDLLLTEDGYALTELDSVPGGIGLTAWLQQQYSDSPSMIEGFRSLAPEGMAIQVSEEASDYKPEMQWLSEQLGEQWHCVNAEDGEVFDQNYRFFELFDWENIPTVKQFCHEEISPPLKPHLEEKLWLAFLHTPSLQSIWKEELREKKIRQLKKIVPFGWVVDPSPLPPHSSLPKLNTHTWEAVKEFSQKERELVLKVSGFSEKAWGSRGVTIGHDCSSKQWSEAIDEATESFESNPYILQRFADTKLVDHPYYDPDTGEVKIMKGRVRLCPYYFVSSDYQEVKLGGVLVTINPADKKKIHGMRDAILTVLELEIEN